MNAWLHREGCENSNVNAEAVSSKIRNVLKKIDYLNQPLVYKTRTEERERSREQPLNNSLQTRGGGVRTRFQLETLSAPNANSIVLAKMFI